MWSWMKYLYLALRLATLWENLAGVKAKAAGTSAADYEPAAAVVLADPNVQNWLGKLKAEEQAQFSGALPLFIWGLDNMTE
jgi:hypothetical protein